MFAGFDTIVRDLWSQVPRLVWCNVNDAYVVHFHRWCWTSRLSGFIFPFIFRYDHFDMSEQAFRAEVIVPNNMHIPNKTYIQGRYRWQDIKSLVKDKGYDSLDELMTTFVDEQVIDIMHSSKTLEAMNAELLRRVKREYSGYMEWISLTMNPVFTVPLSFND